MTNRTIYPPFLPEAPIYDPMFEGAQMSDPWMNWFNSVTRITGYVVTHDRFKTDAAPPINPGDETPIIAVTRLTENERDELENARNGTVIYNLDTDRYNFREAGAWVTFTPVAA